MVVLAVGGGHESARGRLVAVLAQAARGGGRVGCRRGVGRAVSRVLATL